MNVVIFTAIASGFMKFRLLSFCLKTSNCISIDHQPSKLVQDNRASPVKHRHISTTEHAVQTDENDVGESDQEEVGFIAFYSNTNVTAL